MKLLGRMLLGLGVFVAAVNVIWWVAPLFGDPGVYRPLTGIVVVVVASAAWQQMRGKN